MFSAIIRQLCFGWDLIANTSERSFRLRPNSAAMILLVCLFENSSPTVVVVLFRGGQVKGDCSLLVFYSVSMHLTMLYIASVLLLLRHYDDYYYRA